MTMKLFLLIAGLLFSFSISAQTISGRVTNANGDLLIGANIYWVGSSISTMTGPNGQFSIQKTETTGNQLVVSYLGHIPDTFEVINPGYLVFTLQPSESLEEIIVSGQRDGVIISDINPIKTEQITQTELQKAACCDLAGCFD